MPLHRLTRITIGVPNLAQTAAYYADFGLTPAGPLAGRLLRYRRRRRATQAGLRRPAAAS